MGKVDFSPDFKRVFVAPRKRRRCPLADAVHGEHGGLSEGGGEKSARRVAKVRFREQQSPFDIFARPQWAELLDKQVLQEQLLPKPYRHGHAERAETPRREG